MLTFIQQQGFIALYQTENILVFFFFLSTRQFLHRSFLKTEQTEAFLDEENPHLNHQAEALCLTENRQDTKKKEKDFGH